MGNVNDGIMTPNVRTVFPDGTTEVMPTAAAVRKAHAMGLDLVLVAPNAIPPVARAMDYGHWLQKNKRKAATTKTDRGGFWHSEPAAEALRLACMSGTK
jgi:translation initiation factor IF-3